MFQKITKSSIIFWSLEILILITIIWVGTQIAFLFSPVGVFVSSVFVPIILAGVLYYMLNPIVKFLMKVKLFHWRISRTTAVIIIFGAILLILVYLLTSLFPRLISQITHLINDFPKITRETRLTVDHFSRNRWLSHLPVKRYSARLQSYVYENARGLLTGVTARVGEMISLATNFVITAVTVPVMLFYMLKDGHKLQPSLAKMMPIRHRKRALELLNRMSQTISHYIGGQMIECLFVGVFTSIGYFLIHQKYALLLGIFAGICNLIPYVGPYLGILPSLLVALTSGASQLIWVVIVVIIVQQIDGNLIYPNVIGRTLQIHPLTIIIILLAAGHIAGLSGMILAIPLYAVVKTVVQYVYSIWLIEVRRKRA